MAEKAKTFTNHRGGEIGGVKLDGEGGLQGRQGEKMIERECAWGGGKIEERERMSGKMREGRKKVGEKDTKRPCSGSGWHLNGSEVERRDEGRGQKWSAILIRGTEGVG